MTSGSAVPTAPVQFTVYATGPETVRELWFHTDGEWEQMLGRFIGCMLVARMPESGLWEALMSLKDMYEFHVERNARQLPAPSVRSGKGKVVSSAKAPSLILPED